ncbi:hypothetical protein JCM33374_g1341 [Metschnikowia sp. JCM 33374]|nr:hypothetical protein JCM33374_g1341 [Metschnikowia sp. JCM 33374]
MAWVGSSPSLSVPLPLASHIVSLAPLPHTPLVVLVTSTSLVVYDSKSLLPLALHNRLPACIEAHGSSIELKLRQVSVSSAALEKMGLIDVHVRTKSDFVLMYHVAVNYGKSLYEISDVSNTENLLQNSLPLAASNAKNSLSSMFKSATRSLIHGATMGSNMASVEHFEHGPVDDDQRNEYIPLVKVALVKILRLSAHISGFWCKPNSRNLLFFNGEGQLQLLNTRTFKSETVRLLGCPWYFDTTLLAYNAAQNYFLHVNSEFELALLEFDSSTTSTEHTLVHTLLTKLDSTAEKIEFNPQCDLVLIKTSREICIYTLNWETRRKPRFHLIKTFRPFPESHLFDFGWSPCGEFFFCIDHDTRLWKLFSKFGCARFDSAHIESDLATTSSQPPVPPNDPADFCKVSLCAVSSNAQCLFLVNAKRQTLYKLNLLRLVDSQQDTPLFHDGTYISRLDLRGSGAFVRVALPAFVQKFLADMQWINGVSLKNASKKPTGIFTGRMNKYKQISLSFGHEIAVSTPVSMGNEANQVYWFQFYNHYIGSINVVDHIWINDYLLVVNRIQREDALADSINPGDLLVDELILLNTKQSKNGAGGVRFKFDTDLISWRHTFKNRILRMEVSGDTSGAQTLTLITHDMKIIIIDFDIHSASHADVPEQISLDSSKISIKVRRTIHLASIKHKLAINSLKDMFAVGDKHFFFLLDDGDCFLLRNHTSDSTSDSSSGSTNEKSKHIQTTNMYDLIKVDSAIERFQISPIHFEGSKPRYFLTLYKGDDISTYDLKELLARPYEFEGTETSEDGDVSKILRPVKTHTSAFTSMQIFQSNGTICISGFEYQVLWKNENLIIKHRPSRLMILDKFIQRDLFDAKFDKHQLNEKYSKFPNYAYCLELLLFDQLEFIDNEGAFDKVCELVNANNDADTIYVNFLRKIEIHYWDKFFRILKLTPIDFMNKLIDSQNVGLCYNYLSIYLNFKKEHDQVGSPNGSLSSSSDDSYDFLGETEQSIILEIVILLKRDEKWDECFELCRFIKLLEPSGKLLRKVRERIAN